MIKLVWNWKLKSRGGTKTTKPYTLSSELPKKTRLFSPAKEMASLGLRLKAAAWTLRSGAAAANVSRRCSWEMGKGFRGFSSEPESDVPTSGISRPLAEVLKELNKKVPDTVIRNRVEDGCSIKYIPWYHFSLSLYHCRVFLFLMDF